MHVLNGNINNVNIRNDVKCTRCGYNLGINPPIYKDWYGIYAYCPDCGARFDVNVYVIESDEEQLRNANKEVIGFTSKKLVYDFLRSIKFPADNLCVDLIR
ncbi:MAG: hypothetical protein IJT36_01675 [Alphaproteobacteria bacterium]|nr:hypothetical protein [Alphaproteobacteria bacterium]